MQHAKLLVGDTVLLAAWDAVLLMIEQCRISKYVSLVSYTLQECDDRSGHTYHRCIHMLRQGPTRALIGVTV